MMPSALMIGTMIQAAHHSSSMPIHTPLHPRDAAQRYHVSPYLPFLCERPVSCGSPDLQMSHLPSAAFKGGHAAEQILGHKQICQELETLRHAILQE